MRPRRVALVLVALLCGSWMTLDGLRAILLGDYVRIDGQLGPWAALPRALGMDPTALAPLFVLLGLAWLASAVVTLRGGGPTPARAAALLTLWYVPVGTLLAIAALAIAARDDGVKRRTRGEGAMTVAGAAGDDAHEETR